MLDNTEKQCTVKDLKKILDDLSARGYDDMPIYLGDKTPLLNDAICIGYSFDIGMHFNNTYYDKELVECANELKDAMDMAVSKYIFHCYYAGRNIKPDEEATKND